MSCFFYLFPPRLSTLNGSLTKVQLQSVWKALDPSNLRSISLENVYTVLSNRFGIDKNTASNGGSGGSVLDRVKAKILERCGQNGGIKGLGRSLAVMDSSGNKRLSKEELRYAVYYKLCLCSY